LHALIIGTEFATQSSSLEESVFTPETPRHEVYEAIDRYVKPGMVETVKQEFDKRFPQDKWGNSLPMISACNILLNEHLEDLVF
jgi:hypothetical protein